MGLFDKLRGKNDDTEMGHALTHSISSAESSRPQSTQDMLDASAGVNRLLLNDEEATKILRSLGYYCVPAEKEGEKDKWMINPKYIALGMAISHIPRASWYQEIDAQLGIIRSRKIMRRIKMKMTEKEYEKGGALVVDAAWASLIVPNWLGGVHGRIAKLTKVSPRTIEVSYSQSKGKKEGFMP